MERTLARDLFDVYNLVNRLVLHPDFLDKLLLHKIFIYYVCTAKHDFRQLRSNRIDILEKQDIESNLLPVLRSADRFNIQEVKQVLYPFLTEMLDSQGEEIRFIDIFFEQAKYVPSLLFTSPYEHLVKRVITSPAIEWKLLNMKKLFGEV